MATTNKKINFSYFERKQDFTAALQAELANNIVFVEDTKEVFTHGEFFGIRNVTLNYDSSTTRLQLKDGDVVVSEMDATAFVKDGMLDSVSLVKTQEPGVSEAVPYLKFVFNTDAGKSAVRLSVSDLVDSYDGSSIALTQAFAPASSYSAPAAGDSVDVAVGKLLKGHSDNVTALSGKQVAITGAATTVTLNDLTTDRALISSGSGKIAVSGITATELGYLSGVTSAVQTQLDSKQGTLTFDDAPTVASNNVVKSGGVDAAIKNSQRVFYAVTQTAGATAVKEFTIADFPTETINGVKTPLKGTILIAQCTNGDVRTAQLKFKVNDGGEFPIWYGGAAWTAGPNTVIFGGANRTYAYVFDGAEWVWVSSGYDTNTTYTAGSGLKLSSNQFSLNVPRVAKTANSLPGTNTAIIEEYTSGSSYNLPTDAFYHILTFEGEDSRYATQLALGMTTVAAYYRNYTSSTWGSWLRLDNPTMDSTPTAGNTSNVVSSDGIKTYVDTQVATKSNVIFRQWVTQ